MGIIALMFAALTTIRMATFIHPETVKESYEFFMGSELALFPATVLGMSMIRVKKEECANINTCHLAKS